MNPFESEYLDNINTIFTRQPNQCDMWFPSDTLELFNTNLNEYNDSIHLNYYKKYPIYYEYNNYGFRTFDNFSNDGYANVYLGCSHTFGIGHHYNNTWPYKVSQTIGGKVYNISEPSSGIMTQYRYLKYFSNKIKFKNLFHYYPNECWNRYEFRFLGDNPRLLDYKKNSTDVKKYNNFLNDVLLYSETVEMINMVYIDAIKNICKMNGANYFLLTDSYAGNVVDPYHKTKTPARDLLHYYVEDYNDIANIFIEKYEKNQTKIN